MIKDESEYISLKDAAQISGYTPDYIGQLIRSGKLHGKQVYQNVAWMTTADEVRKYVQRKKNGEETLVKRQMSVADITGTLSRYLAPMLYVLIGLLVCLFLVLFYALSSSIERHIDQKAIDSVQKKQLL